MHTAHATLCDFLSSQHSVDCKIWGDIQQQVHQSQLHSIGKLKKRLLDVWDDVMEQSVIDEASSSVSAGKRHTFRATVVNLTVALCVEPYDKICFVSSNVTFVICLKCVL